MVRSVSDRRLRRGRQVRAAICGSSALDAVHDLNDIGARLALDVQNDRRRELIQAASLLFSGPLIDVGHVGQTHGIAVAIGDDDGRIFVGGHQSGRWR